MDLFSIVPFMVLRVLSSIGNVLKDFSSVFLHRENSVVKT